MSLLLPDGVSESSLSEALKAFTEALGAAKVLSAAEEIEEFRDPFQPVDWVEYRASAVLMPTTVEEIQAIVRIAGEHGVPLWTHGQGRNNGYGGAAPRVKGAVTVSLRNMNRVLEINEELAYAEVEPGTTWLQLYEAIQAGGHDLLVSCTDLGWGSVIGNSLDHGLTYTPNGNDFAAPCGMEVVLADGTLLRTGMGAMDGNPSWHLYKRSLGPSLDTLFMQSNFGIVTKMGLWLQPTPEVYAPLWIKVWNETDIVALVDTLRRLRLDRTIESVPTILNTLLYASGATRRSDWYTGEGPMPDATIDTVAKELDCGRFIVRLGLFGDEAVVAHQIAKIKAAIGRIPGAQVTGEAIPASDRHHLEHPVERVCGGVPNLELNHQTGWYGEEEGGHIGFAPVVPLVGEKVYAFHQQVRHMIETRANLDWMNAQIISNQRTEMYIGFIAFDTKDEAQSRRAYDTSEDLIRLAGENGYGEYRAHLDHMDLAQSRYDYNNGAYLRFVEKIKDAVDPQGILSPGKQGIWPAHLRDGSHR